MCYMLSRVFNVVFYRLIKIFSRHMLIFVMLMRVTWRLLQSIGCLTYLELTT
ncbi:uncharacterized protein Smp_202620 [Schistosoma mansoni]|uniref:Smp_202620 n=1 Tax=Schistosoma mansoni TaxID=6183 RepID=G4VHH7_SCHMA|nr:uncharacterized protein Smp_202620 [Schistosoma mansoni]|eukprot:XP_018652444.1 uncharacterized protein Smp_202620 [Schistosoma mansoni]